MFHLSLPTWEFAVRAAVVYLFLLICFRVLGKRQIGQLAPFDLVLLLIISNAVQNSMNGGDNSLIGGLISAATLLLLNFAVAWLIYRNRKMANLIDGRPQILIHDGQVLSAVLDREKLSLDELREALRGQGYASMHEIRYAILETTGKISVIKKSSEAATDPRHATVKWHVYNPEQPPF